MRVQEKLTTLMDVVSSGCPSRRRVARKQSRSNARMMLKRSTLNGCGMRAPAPMLTGVTEAFNGTGCFWIEVPG